MSNDETPLLQLLRPELAELRSYVPEHPQGIDVHLDANEAPPPRSAALKEAVRRGLEGVALERYPDARASALKAQIAARTGAPEEELLLGTGSDEVISLIVNALARPRKAGQAPALVTVTPTFVMYKVTARAHGFKVLEVPLDAAWDVDVAGTKRALEMAQPNVVFFATPNNPTGNALSEKRLREIIEAARGAFILIDEAYGDFAGASLRGLRAAYGHVGILRTLSKIGLAALRVGWLEADAALVAEIDKGRQPFNVSATSQAAATAVLRDAWDAVTEEVAAVVAERGRVAAALAAMAGVVVTPSAANFLWVRTPRPAAEVHGALAARGVLVRSFHGGGGRLAHQLRVTIGTRSDNDRFLEAFGASIA